MSQRISVFETSPAAVKALFGLEQYVAGSSLDPAIYKLSSCGRRT